MAVMEQVRVEDLRDGDRFRFRGRDLEAFLITHDPVGLMWGRQARIRLRNGDKVRIDLGVMVERIS